MAKNTTFFYKKSKYKPPAPTARVLISTIFFEEMKQVGDVALEVDLLLDTGADISFIPNSFLIKLEQLLGEELECSFREVKDYNGRIYFQRQICLKIPVQKGMFGDNKYHDFLVLDDGEDGILGREILNDYKICMNGQQWSLAKIKR